MIKRSMIRLRSLELAGFGIFQHPETFTFSPFHIEIRENEEGKSTLVGGILATIFGLTKEEKREWYSWARPHHFYGILVWERNGEVYCLKRDFQNDRVRLSRKKRGSKSTLFEGVHKPSGRTPTKRHYEGLIQELMGVQTKKMAKTLFCAAQEAIAIDLTNRTLQTFITGEGTKGYQDVLDKLADELQKITKETKGIGTSSDKLKDRLLERLKEELNQVCVELKESSHTLEETYKKRHELQELERSIIEKKTKRGDKERFWKSWGDWQRLRSKMEDIKSEQVLLDHAVKGYEEADQKYRDLKGTLQGAKLDRFKGAPEDLRDRLERIKEIEKQVKDTLDIDAKITGIREELDTEYRDIIYLPSDIVSTLKDLKIMRNNEQQTKGEIDQIKRKRAILVGLIGGALILILSLLLYALPLSLIIGFMASLIIGLLAYRFLPVSSANTILWDRLSSIERGIEELESKLKSVASDLKEWKLEESQWPEVERRLKAKDKLIDDLRQLMETKEYQQKNISNIMEERKALASYFSGESQSAETTLKDLHEYEQRLKELSNLQERMNGILQGQGAKTLEELYERRIDIQNRVLVLTKQIDDIEANYPALKGLIQKGPSEQQQEFESLRYEIEHLGKELEEKEGYKDSLRRDIAELSSRELINIESRNEEIKDLEKRISEAEAERDALMLLYRALEDAVVEYQATYKDRLQQKIGEYFTHFTLGRYRDVFLDETFGITICHRDGHILTPSQLSQGARDQLYLACRLAVNEILTGEGKYQLPLIFDDSFIHFDNERLKEVKNVLEVISQRHQIILLSHDALRLEDWAK